MRMLIALLATIACLVVAAPSSAADPYGTPIWCTVTTTGLPGGPVTHRLGVRGFQTDPVTNIVGYVVGGVNITNTADAYGYGHTSGGGAFPISFAWTDSPTLASSIVRQWRVNFESNLTGNARVVDLTTGGTFTAVGTSSLQCTF